MNRNISILVVDDDALIRDCITAFLEDEGFTVMVVKSAEEALELLKSSQPAICITDLRLPAMNGEQLVLAGSTVSPKTRFLIHSGSAYLVSKELADIGICQSDVINKPVHDMNRLTDYILIKATLSGT